MDDYFDKKEEQAVIDYINTTSRELKNKIYNEILIGPFRKMIESILRRYPIHIGNYDMSEVELNALSHLIEHMVKYRPFIIEKKFNNCEKWVKLDDEHRFMVIDDAEEKFKTLDVSSDYEYRIFYSKAFSYCQTIIRNYYKDHGKKSYAEKKINVPYDDYADDINESSEYCYEIEYESHNSLENLINDVILKIEDSINGDIVKKNEVIVGDAFINILKNWHILFMEDSPDGKYNKRVTNKFAKNKILFFLKEQTDLSTKEIRVASKPFKEIYFILKCASLKK